MTVETLRQNWALFVALALLLVVGLVVSMTVYRRSGRAQLMRTLKDLRAAQRRQASTQKSVAQAERRLAKLEARAAEVKPRTLEEARGSLADARALNKIADDQVLIAANHVRRIILEEYPPASHEALRARYLPTEAPDRRPFSF